MKEQRRYVRIDLCVEINYKLSLDSAKALKSTSRNISRGGMCFLAGEKLSTGSIIELVFRLPDDKKRRIECTAKVVWQSKEGDGYLTGIEFINMDINEQSFIETFVSRFLSELTDYELP